MTYWLPTAKLSVMLERRLIGFGLSGPGARLSVCEGLLNTVKLEFPAALGDGLARV